MWEFLVETNLLNFLIFAVLVLILQHKVLGALWKKRNEEIKEQLESAESAKVEAEKALKNAEAEFEQFKVKFAEMKQEQKAMAKEMRESLKEENQQKIEELKAKYQREIQRIADIASEEVRNEIVQVASRMAIDLIQKDSDLKDAFNKKSLSKILEEAGK